MTAGLARAHRLEKRIDRIYFAFKSTFKNSKDEQNNQWGRARTKRVGWPRNSPDGRGKRGVGKRSFLWRVSDWAGVGFLSARHNADPRQNGVCCSPNHQSFGGALCRMGRGGRGRAGRQSGADDGHLSLAAYKNVSACHTSRMPKAIRHSPTSMFMMRSKRAVMSRLSLPAK